MTGVGKKLGLILAGSAALSLAGLWNPLSGRRAHARENVADIALAKRTVQISPAELAHLMHNRQVALSLFDLRSEGDFNTFHLLDAKRVDRATLDPSTLKKPVPRRVIVLVDENEQIANRAYRQLAGAGIPQVYILEGGIPAWLALFSGHSENGEDTLAAGSLGGRHPASYPNLEHADLPKFEPKVKLLGAGKKGAAGCGG